MDKNAIKKYAVWARRELIARVSQKAIQYGITAEDCGEGNAESINGTVLTATEKKQRQALISEIKEKGYEQVMEEVAYTWFNRFSALRFMEVNGYLPSHVRVFTDEDNNFKPQIITEAIHLEMDGLDMEKVYALKDANKTDELYKYLIITQCNALSSILPGMFQRIEDFSELLFPDNLLRNGSAIQQMIELIPEEDWKDAVQIIGWLYQYYNSEKKDDVFAALKKNVKITKDNIPAATQLFTPDWIVRYMVENSLGRLWLEGHPNDTLKAEWKYYLDEAEQEVDVQKQLDEIRREYAGLKPEDIKCIDPCMGSGHILAYMFDVLVQIYESYGYSNREAVESIVKNNIYGLDIDDRAAQLANFAVMMKARQYDRRFFTRGMYPHVYAIKESNGVHISAPERLGDERKIAEKLIHGLHDAKEYGSILKLDVTMGELAQLRKRLEEIDEMSSMGNLLVMMESGEIIEALAPLIDIAETMVQKYAVVVTNPPYMGTKGMTGNISYYLKEQYPDSKADLFAVFIERALNLSSQYGYISLITQRTWLFISAFEKLRSKVLEESRSTNFLELGAGAFEDLAGEVVQSVVFVLSKSKVDNYLGKYLDLTGIDEKKDGIHLVKQQLICMSEFQYIPGTTFAMKLSNKAMEAYSMNKYLSDISSPRKGLISSDNNRFLRLWYEVSILRVQFGIHEISEQLKGKRWIPHNKGGSFRRWYGNQEYLINWESDGEEVKAYAGKLYGSYSRQIMNERYYFMPSVSWSSISSQKIGLRFYQEGFTFDTAGPSLFISNERSRYIIGGFLSSCVAEYYIKATNPTINLLASDIANLPLIYPNQDTSNTISNRVRKCIDISKEDWNSFENSWDFFEHPFVRWAKGLWDCTAIGATMSHYYGGNRPKEVGSQMELCYLLWQGECNERFSQLKANEEELNRIFIDIYGLQDELTPEVEDKYITVRKADLKRDVKSFISYAVGCMFGRYSLYNQRILYAGGYGGDLGSLVEKIQDNLKTQGLSMFPENEFYPDSDNIIPICDDEYFEDDIVGRFIEFVKVVYGAEGLEANLQFVADALEGKGSSREVIRNYFCNDFYNDHCKMYQKRPIYWLFDSGKKGGFKALIYMHRYQQDTIARMRTDYVHEQQARYRTEISDLEVRIAGASTSERVKLNKRLVTLQAQADEIHGYEEKIHHLADQMIRIDLDDGVKNNYEIFKDVLAKIK